MSLIKVVTDTAVEPPVWLAEADIAGTPVTATGTTREASIQTLARMLLVQFCAVAKALDELDMDKDELQRMGKEYITELESTEHGEPNGNA